MLKRGGTSNPASSQENYLDVFSGISWYGEIITSITVPQFRNTNLLGQRYTRCCVVWL